jgi:SCY1-like protein 2
VSRPLFGGPKTVQASVTLLEQLPVLLDKVTQADLQQEVLPMVYLALESNMSQVQVRNNRSLANKTLRAKKR